MTVVDEVRPSVTVRRRRYLLVGLLAAAVLAALIAAPVSNWYVDRPHGNPDPGGRRMAFLTRSAREAVPASALDGRVTVEGYSWDAGGCDGGSAGWGRGVVTVTFRAATPAMVDAAMASIGWRISRWIGGVRDYVPATRNRYNADATLFASKRGWMLSFSADPAEVPTHAC